MFPHPSQKCNCLKDHPNHKALLLTTFFKLHNKVPIHALPNLICEPIDHSLWVYIMHYCVLQPISIISDTMNSSDVRIQESLTMIGIPLAPLFDVIALS